MIKQKIPYVENCYTKDRKITVFYLDSWWFATPFIVGTAPQLGDKTDSLICFSMLTKLHNMSKVKNMKISEFMFWQNDSYLKLGKTMEIIQNALSHSIAVEMGEYYHEVIATINMHRISNKYYRSAVTHGDYHSGNIIMKNKKVEAIIDWDNSNFAPRVVDIAKGVYMLSRKCHDRFELDYDIAFNLLYHYNNISPLDEEEFKIIPAYLSAAFIPKPEYLLTFKSEAKLKWYLKWTYEASKNSVRLNDLVKEFIVRG